MCQRIAYKLVTTRKPHRCFGCEEQYPKGSRLHAQTMRGDGKVYTLHLCDRCNVASQQYRYPDVYYEGQLKELWKSVSEAGVEARFVDGILWPSKAEFDSQLSL